MAIKAALRFKPDTYRSGMETLIEGFNPATGTGTIILPVQVVMYDDTVVTGANYTPGDPASERNINVLYEDQLRFDIAALTAMTQANLSAFLTSQLNAWGQIVKPGMTGIGRIVLAAKRATPQALV